MNKTLQEQLAGLSTRSVYSTDKGRLCPECQMPLDDCRCAETASQQILGDGKVRIRRETKGRKGKGVSIVEGLAMNASDLEKLAKDLKTRCGCGGAVKGGTIEIQGDQRTLIQQLLAERGIAAKIAGG